jgi:DNA-binding NtrC family response regulator
MDNPKALIVDDDSNILKVLSANISENGFLVETCQNGERALEILEHDNGINVVVADLEMEEMSGKELFQEINQLYPYIPVIILTAYGSVESAVELVKKGAFDYLEKPSNHIQLIKVLQTAVRHNSLQREIQFLRQELDKKKTFCDLVGKSRKMFEVFERIKVVADSNFNVLIEGESGTGKELVAKAIHQKSHRKDKPFVTINCAAIPLALMESELFGHEQGAFTGALKQKTGKFELANSGTIFLDEIGELDKALQKKLLRVLEDRIIQRVGGNADINTDFRLIAATNRDLKKEVQKKQFRSDLYYRLNVIDIKIPPLRNRKEDVLCLIEYFLKKYSTIEKKEITEIAPQALAVLYDYDWPGNVRELENIIKRAIVFCKNQKIKKSDLPSHLISTRIQALNVQEKKEVNKTTQREKNEIIKTLSKAGGNKTKASELLGIHRRQLYRKIDEYNIDCNEL